MTELMRGERFDPIPNIQLTPAAQSQLIDNAIARVDSYDFMSRYVALEAQPLVDDIRSLVEQPKTQGNKYRRELSRLKWGPGW